MENLFSPQAWLVILPGAALALAWLAAGLLFYGWLADRVMLGRGRQDRPAPLGPFDAAVAATLAGLMLFAVAMAARAPVPAAGHHERAPDAGAIVGSVVVSAVLSGAIIGGILASLTGRGIRWREVFGFTRVAAGGVFGWAVALLAAALPLVYGGMAVSWLLLAAAGRVDNAPQELVQFLGASPSLPARWTVAFFAVVVAPLQEEFIFRGYLYGVARRYAGVTVGLLFNATLFALIHLHAPSSGGLFALAVCLTLAYEWTGSLFVPVVMHGLFNALSVASLLHGNS